MLFLGLDLVVVRRGALARDGRGRTGEGDAGAAGQEDGGGGGAVGVGVDVALAREHDGKVFGEPADVGLDLGDVGGALGRGEVRPDKLGPGVRAAVCEGGKELALQGVDENRLCTAGGDKLSDAGEAAREKPGGEDLKD